VLPGGAGVQIDHHRSRRQRAGERKPGIHATPIDGQPMGRMIRRDCQADEEFCLSRQGDDQLHDPLPMILSSLRSGANPRRSFSGPAGPSFSRRAESVWMNSPMEQATWSARFLCTNHMRPTQHTASERDRTALAGRQPSVRLACPATERFLKFSRCDIFANKGKGTSSVIRGGLRQASGAFTSSSNWPPCTSSAPILSLTS
jgi:hypothetical protein